MATPALVAVLGTAAMLTLAFGLWLPAYLRYRELQRRLRGFVHAGADGGLALDLGGRRRARASRRVGADRTPFLLRYLARRIARSQADVSVGEVLGAMAVLSALAFVLGAVWWQSVVAGAGLALLAAALPVLWLEREHRRMRKRSSAQLPDAVALLSGSVRSGHSLLQAIEHVASDAPEPTRSNFAVVVREIGLGAAQDDALERLAERMSSEDVDLIVSAINVHSQIGGSLAEILDAIGTTIRERALAEGDIRAITAQQRYSAYVLALLPVVTIIGLSLISPDYVAVFFEEGPLRAAAAVAGGMVVVGFFAMRSLASIDV